MLNNTSNNNYTDLKRDKDKLDSNEIFAKKLLTNITFSEFTLKKSTENIKYYNSIGYILRCHEGHSCFGKNKLMDGYWIPNMNIPDEFKENGWFIESKHLQERKKLNCKSKKYYIDKYMALDPIVKELQDNGAIYILSLQSYNQCDDSLNLNLDLDLECRTITHCDYKLNEQQINSMIKENKELKDFYFDCIRQNGFIKSKINEVNEKIYYKIVLFFILFLIMNLIHLYFIQDSYYKYFNNTSPEALDDFIIFDNQYDNDIDSNKYIQLYNKLYNNEQYDKELYDNEITRHKLQEAYNNIKFYDDLEELYYSEISDFIDDFDSVAFIYLPKQYYDND